MFFICISCFTYLDGNIYGNRNNERNVQIIGYSSDEDTPLLKDMKVKNNLSDCSVNCWKGFFVQNLKATINVFKTQFI